MLITISRNRDHDRPESVITIARNPQEAQSRPTCSATLFRNVTFSFNLL
jgi:hypothetical protein